MKLRSGIEVPQEVIDDFGKRIFPEDRDAKIIVRIRWFDKYITTPSGKSSWSSVGAAKNAIHNAVKSYKYTRDLFETLTGEKYDPKIHHWECDGIYDDLFNTLQAEGILRFVVIESQTDIKN